MSTSEAAEASAPLPGTHAEKPETSLESEPKTRPEPTGAEETEPQTAVTNGSPSPSDSHSEGEYSGSDTSEQRDPGTTDKPADEAQPPLPNEPLPDQGSTGPPLPNEPVPSNATAPPLPAEPVPASEDDGWEFHWNPNDQSYWFYNRLTGVWQKDNPRQPTTAPSTSTPSAPAPEPALPPGETALSNPTSVAGGYNPAIHGSYDENAWYAQNLHPPTAATAATLPGGEQGEDYTTAAFFNRHTGQWQTEDQGVERHTDEAKSRRQMRAFFDVDAAANMHDGRSLKAERSGIKPSRSELKAFKERRRAKKEEKRRAWLRD
jgi:hypothetical protein